MKIKLKTKQTTTKESKAKAKYNKANVKFRTQQKQWAQTKKQEISTVNRGQHGLRAENKTRRLGKEEEKQQDKQIKTSAKKEPGKETG